MDLHTAVALSMLPASRLSVAAVFKEFHQFSDENVLDAVLDACGVAPSEQAAIKAQARLRAEKALHSAFLGAIEAIPSFDPRYPVLLACIPDPPPVLWIKGAPGVLSRPAVAVVGSRAATEYALQVGQRLGSELAARGVVVASGLARGVDSAAHRGCLGVSGQTVAVLGSGLDRIYPREHEALAESICAGGGALVSELGPGAPPLAEHFPLRNRIISGISLAVVVVEASEKSGSLITARCALDQGRDVMAVPGNVLSGRNRGSHRLLKDGAKVVEAADDILDELGWPVAGARAYSNPKLLDSDPLLSRMDPGEVYKLDDLMALTGVAAPKLLPRLMELELQGLIAVDGGGGFARTGQK
jgi:DNA processing protein